MNFNFNANHVHIITQRFDGLLPDVVTIGFGEGKDEENLSKYLVLQRGVENDEDNEEFYVEYCDQSNSVSKYECLELFELSRDSVKMIFTEKTDFAKEISITFDIDAEHFENVKKCLSDIIFRDSKCFLFS